MININKYVKKFGEKTFDEAPFNSVDGLIFAELSMINFELVLQKKRAIALKDIVFEDFKKVIYGSPDARANGIMLKNMMRSKRYQDVQVGYVKRIFEEKVANQFYAVTFILPDGTLFLSYRGTDITIVGWREDLYMTYMESILSQYQALQYAEEVLSKLPGNFILGGHSKGGNLAVFTAANLNPIFNDRLISIYTYDGPGFRTGTDRFINYPVIKDKINKFLTHRDFIGLIFNSVDDYRIVYATGVLLGGHDPFTWKIDKTTGDFVYKTRCTKNAQVIARATNMWIDEMTDDEKILGVNALVAIIGKAKDIYGLLRYFVPNVVRYGSVMRKFPKEDRDKMRKTVRLFFQCLKTSRKLYSLEKERFGTF